MELDEVGLQAEASQGEGLGITGEVKLLLGEDIYVEHRPFRGITPRDGEAVGLEVPRFITELVR